MANEPEDSRTPSGPGVNGPKPSAAADPAKSRARRRTGNQRPSSVESESKAKRRTVLSIVDEPRVRGTPAGLAIAEEAQALLVEANANTQALIDTVNAIIRAETIEEIVRATLDT